MFVCIFCCITMLCNAQQGIAINEDGSAPSPSAILDIKSTNKGMLVPRLSQDQKNGIVTPANGLLVFQTDGQAGFYYFTGGEWVFLSTDKTSWSNTGNAGTNNTIDFIGTTDAQDLNVRTNNVDRLRISQTGQLEILNTGQSVFIGQQAGESDDLTNNYNVFVGYRAGFSNTTGNFNLASGYRALNSNINGYRNTALGADALFDNTSGYNNTVAGWRSLFNNTTGYDNTAVGAQTLNANTDGFRNTAIGYRSLYFNVGGDQNTATGYQTLYRNTTANRSSAHGFQALRNNTEGLGNSGSGYRALYNNTTGNYNTGIGYSANSVGTDIQQLNRFGYNADNTASNSVVVGNANVNSIGGQVGWTTLSDGRFKKNIRNDEVKGLDFIIGLQPVTYNYDIHAKERWMEQHFGEKEDTEWEGKYDIENIRFSGFIAQDVEELSKSLGYDFSGVDAPKNDKDIYGLRYSEFVVPLVKAVQELNEELQKKEKFILDLINKQEQLIKELQENSNNTKRRINLFDN